MNIRHAGRDDCNHAAEPADVLQLWLALAVQRARAQRLASELDAVRASVSWRVTRPLRALKAHLHAPSGSVGLRPATDAAVVPVAADAQALALPAPLQVWVKQVRRLGSADGARLLVDVTEVDLEDLGAGIQRVTKHVLVELLRAPLQDVAVLPVRLTPDGRYCPAWRFCERLFGLPVGYLGVEQAIAPLAGDCFLGLDFCRRHHHAFALALDALKKAGVRVLIVVYDLLPLVHPKWFPHDVVNEYRAWLPLVAGHADVALCISDDTRSELTATFNALKLRFGGQAATIRLGADALWSGPPRTAASTIPCILMVGTVEPRKGHAEALDAVERLWADGRQVRLVLAGHAGWHSDALQRRIRGHRQYGVFLHWDESSDDVALAQLYASADLLLMASMGEGFGLPIAEAGRAGCRLLVRDLPVFREAAGDRAQYFADGDLQSALAAFLDAPQAWPAPRPETWPSWRDCAARIVQFVPGPGLGMSPGPQE